MAIVGADFQVDWESRNDEIAVRLCRVREFLNLTQTQFADQLSITRDRIASYEDGRTALRCDVGIRLCRHFFVNEYWLATGSVDDKTEQAGKKADISNLAARLTMALAAEPGGGNSPPGIEFGQGFLKYLRPYYLRELAKHPDFPRIVFLPNDGPEYLLNAFACAIQFWKDGLKDESWQSFLDGLFSAGNNCRHVFANTNSAAKGPEWVKKK